MKTSIPSLCLLSLLVTTPALAQEVAVADDVVLKVRAQYRPRFLVHTGLDFRGADSEVREFVSHRARLGFGLFADSGLGVQIVGQDVRIWGEETNTLNDFSADGLDFHEAYAVLPIADGLEVKLGRQEIVVENSRLVGNVGWTQRARSFDGVTARYSIGPFEAMAAYAKIIEAGQFPEGNVPDGRGGDTDFGGVTVKVKVADPFAATAMYFANIIEPTEDHRHTVGALVGGKANGLSYSAEYYHQLGKLGDEDVSALLAAGRVGYTLDVAGKPGLTALAEYLSGDGTPQGTFNTLYATNHKFYGFMDFFLNIPVNTANLGLIDVGGRASVAIADVAKIMVDYHHLRSAESDPQGENHWGDEVDLSIAVSPAERVKLLGTWGVFFPGEAMRTRFGYDQSVDLKPDALFYLTLDTKF